MAELQKKLEEVLNLQKKYSSLAKLTPEMERRRELIRNEIPQLLENWARERGFDVEGGDGFGQPSYVPYVRVFDAEISSGATQGNYAVFLFAAKGSAVFLSLNQPATELNGKNYIPLNRGDLLQATKAARSNLEGRLQNLEFEINLERNNRTVRNYEAGNICAARYGVGYVPEDATIFADIERILSLWKLLNPHAKSSRRVKSGFRFVAKGWSKMPPEVVVELAEKERKIIQEHNEMQGVLYEHLVKKFGVGNVACENIADVNTRIDLVVRQDTVFRFYEIKTASSPRVCIRLAIGQLLEYAFFGKGRPNDVKLVVVGKSPIDESGAEYLQRLNEKFSLSISYEMIPSA